MAQVNAGRVRFVSRGEYNNSTQYYLFDLVDYNGSSYFAKANTTGNVPTNTTYWQLVAEKGNTGGDGPVGPTGNGIASIVKTASAGLIDTYTITFTDGTTSTFNITNGQDGEVTQEYVDEENERLKSVFNVLPKVSDSGESVTLENTGDTMLYKMDLKGNTSQEVIQGEVGLEVENTSVYVDDVNTTKENYINLKGNTYQETTSISGGDQYDSPSPDYPQEIEVVTGLNEVVVCGKNVLDIQSYLKQSDRGITPTYNQNGSVTLSGTATATYSNFVSDISDVLEKNKTYTLSVTGTKNFAIGCRLFYSDNTYEDFNITSANTYVNITPTKDVSSFRIYIYSLTSGTSYNSILYFQLEVGSTATPYEPYQGASYPVNLGSIELCKIGTYQDRIYKSNGDWYLHKEIGKVVLDGSESWGRNTTATSGEYRFSISITNCKLGLDIPLKSNYFINTTQTTYSNRGIGGRTDEGGVFINDSSLCTLTLEQFETWASTHNILVYYPLATPTETQITDTTLVSQLEALYTASIHAITHINTETSNLLPYIDLKYNVVTASPSPDRASEVEVVKGNNTITISNEDGTKTQSYNLTLGNLELCKIGDYQDYLYKDSGKWYKYNAICKVILKGSGDTELWGNGGSFENFWEYQRSGLIGGNGTMADVKTNYFNQTDNSRVVILGNGGLYLRFPKATGIDVSTATLMNNWLSTHNTIVYYVLATATETQITDQLLVSQLDELQKAMSYYDKTLITQVNASKPFILDVIGIRDLQDIFNL